MTIPDENPFSRKPAASRFRVTDELGRTRTLDHGPAAWLQLAAGSNDAPLLLLGLGPSPLAAPPLAVSGKATPPAHDQLKKQHRLVAWLEAPAMTAQLPSAAERGVPHTWQQLAPEAETNTTDQGLSAFLEHCQKAHADLEIWLYAQETRLFSAFWGEALGEVRARLTGVKRAEGHPVDRLVLLPGEETGLLTHELEAAFASRGYAVQRLPEEPAPCLAMVTALVRESRPALFFSVNLRGLDPEGTLVHLLRACGVPVGIWFVDNPWHCLSRLRLPWWRAVPLFVTDASFVAPLRTHGAAQVTHLPLAAWYSPHTLAQASAGASVCETLQPLVFVGRSAFPGRDAFFAACRTPETLQREATALAGTNTPPHVHWWGEKLGLATWWPGSACREAGFGAETASLRRRRLWLDEASRHGLTVFGDEGWRTLQEGLAAPNDVRPPLDYYGTLPHVYAAARYSLNVTSLLLPAGLTQRHFDVWMAGGFLLGDATPGLALFPAELARETALPTAQDLGAALRRFEADASLRQHLQSAWQAEISSRHMYGHRVDTLGEYLRMP